MTPRSRHSGGHGGARCQGLWLRLAARLAGSALLAGFAVAQAPIHAGAPELVTMLKRPKPVTPEQLGLQLWTVGSGADRRILGLSRADAPDDEAPEFPLATAVRSLDLADFGAGDAVALAGGFGEPLAIYLLDLVERRQSRLDTSDGRRLPPAFCGGLGTWPQRVEHGLFLVCWEGPRSVEFRAWTARGVRAARQLPLSCVGYGAVSDAGRRALRVQFLGAEADGPLDVVEVLLLAQPRPVLTTPDDDQPCHRTGFGVRRLGERRRLELRLFNPGEVAFRGRVDVIGEDFAIVEPTTDLELPPGASRRLEVEFAASQIGRAGGRLRVLGPGGRELVGCVLSAQVEDRPDLPVEAVPEVVRSTTPGGSVGRAEAPPGVPAVETPRPDPVEQTGGEGSASLLLMPPVVDRPCLEWNQRGRLLLHGQLRAALAGPHRAWPPVAVRNRETGQQVVVTARGSGGGFVAELGASAGDVLELGWADGRVAAPWRVVGTAPPDLVVTGDDLLLRVPPGQPFLLVRGPDPRESSASPDPGLFRGTAPWDGELRLVGVAGWLGGSKADFGKDLWLVCRDAAGVAVTTPARRGMQPRLTSRQDR